MSEPTLAKRSIVLAVALDNNDQALIHTGRVLAKKLNASLKLVHALKPLFSYVGSGDIVVNPYYGYELDFSEKEEKAALKKLNELSALVDDGDVSVHVRRDFVPEAILNFAQEKQAGLILCGVHAKEDTPKRFFSGISTAYALASDADVPVLLVPLRQAPDFNPPLRVLVADNLENEGEKALEAALWLANALQAAELIHMHVQPMSRHEIDRMIETVRESMILGQIPSDSEISLEYYLERVVAMTREELLRRCRGRKLPQLTRTNYEPVVGFGNPADAVHDEVLQRACRLMVFGRHHLLRRKTLSLGRIPYHAMIEQGVATLIVPDRPIGGPSIFTMDPLKPRGKEL